MAWNTVDTQDDLDRLAASVCWEDSETIELHAGRFPWAHAPGDVNRSGSHCLDLHVLLRADAQAPFLELAFMHCDYHGANALWQVFVQGRVDSLMRVEITSVEGTLHLRCARLLWRWLDEVDMRRPHYPLEVESGLQTSTSY